MLDGESSNRRGHARAALRGVVMPVHQVPRRAVALTELGLGVSQFGNLYRKTTDEEARSALDAAWVAGIRYFDTAPHYGLGLSERRLGALLADRPRKEYVLSTKVGRLLVPSPETAGERDDQGFDVPATHRRVWDFSRDSAGHWTLASTGSALTESTWCTCTTRTSTGKRLRDKPCQH